MKIEVLDKGYVELQDTMGDDLAIVNAARVSYLGESKGDEADKKLLNYLWRNNHASPFEMAVLKVKVHCPLFVRSQWHRHRTFSYNEVSRRYTSEEIEFHIPEIWRVQDTKNKQSSNGASPISKDISKLLLDISTQAEKQYTELVEIHGVAREQARMLLPQNLYTTFIATGNLRNWLHFCSLRSDSHAQEEIRVYSDAILHQFIQAKFPWTYEAFIGAVK